MTDVSKWELVTQPTFLKGGCWASATLNKNIRAVRRRKVYQKKNDEDITGYAVNMETWQYSDRTDIYPAFCSLFSFSQFRRRIMPGSKIRNQR